MLYVYAYKPNAAPLLSKDSRERPLNDATTKREVSLIPKMKKKSFPQIGIYFRVYMSYTLKIRNIIDTIKIYISL